MGDSELEAIKARRMAELSKQYGGNMPQNPEEQAAAEEKKREAEQQRGGMLASVMRPEARERLSRIALVKPDKARGVENMILAMAQRGQITEKVSDEHLLKLLEQVNEQLAPKAATTVIRRRPLFDDD